MGGAHVLVEALNHPPSRSLDAQRDQNYRSTPWWLHKFIAPSVGRWAKLRPWEESRKTDNGEKLIYIPGINASIIFLPFPHSFYAKEGGSLLFLKYTNLSLTVLGREYPALRSLLFLKGQVSAQRSPPQGVSPGCPPKTTSMHFSLILPHWSWPVAMAMLLFFNYDD